MTTQNQDNKHATELIDWLSVTYSPDALRNWFPHIIGPADFHIRLRTLTNDDSLFTKGKARYGYTDGYKSVRGTIVYAHLERHGMDFGIGRLGVHIVYPGSALNSLESHLRLLGMHLERGAKVRRIDLARDTFYFDIDLSAMLNEFLAGDANTRARNCRLITGTVGETFYAGSRKSPTLFRHYDKGAQTGGMPAGIWYRAEIEIKGDRAHGVAMWIHENGEFSAAEAIKAFYQSDCAEWQSAMAGTAQYGVIPSEKKTTDTKAWLINSIAPVVAKHGNQSKQFFEDFWEAVQTEMQRRVGEMEE